MAKAAGSAVPVGSAKAVVAGAEKHCVAVAGAEQHRVAVAGASGRMGHMLIEAIRASGDCKLTGALDIPASPAIGNDAAAFLGHASGVPVSADVRAGLAHSSVLIDITRPEGTLAHLKVCRELGVNAVIGTTVPIPLAMVTRSGVTPQFSKPQKAVPVRPNPVCTSSATQRPPCLRTIS